MMNQTQQPTTAQPSRPKNGNSRKFFSKPTNGGKPRQGKGKSRFAQKQNRRPAAAPAKPRGPVKEYISACCGVRAVKPPCGKKEVVLNPESKKPKEVPKGLGKWRCSQCRKSCKVTARKPQPVITTIGTDLAVVGADRSVEVVVGNPQ